MVAVGDEHERVRPPPDRDQHEPEHEVDRRQRGDDAQPPPQPLKFGALDERLHSRPHDPDGGDDDQQALEARRDVGDLAVPVRVVLVCGLRGVPQAEARDASRREVDHGLERVREDRRRAGQEVRRELAREHHEGDAQRRRHREALKAS